MSHQKFDCTTKGQTEFIGFCKNLKFLDPKDKKAQSNSEEASSTVKSNNQTPQKKCNRIKATSSLTDNLTKRRTSKFCLVYGNCGHTTNKCNIMCSSAKQLKAKESNWHFPYHSRSDERSKQCSKEELNVIIDKIIKVALKKECLKLCGCEEVKAIKKFNALSVSSSGLGLVKRED
eukprot:15348253-Ditylum_brightwellii.AAC.1